MKGFSVFLQKEWREQTRNLKILWIPIVFVILGIIEPVSNYYLPEIMKHIGNMPEGSEFLWPTYTGEEILISLLGQYQLIGVLVIVLAFMGAISGERKNGTATLLYVRPISFKSYFLSKWLVVNGIVLGSIVFGFMAALYYISILFNGIPIGTVFQFIGIYSVWIVFIVTLVLTLSAMFSAAITATISLLITLILPVIDSLIGEYWMISPWKLPMYATYAFEKQADFGDMWWSMVITIILIVLMIFLGILMSKRNAAKTTV